MDPLPKIARDRLRANLPAEHPDADLLTAFAEHSLSERERLPISDHLSRCAECRQVVAVAVPEIEPAAAVPAQAAITKTSVPKRRFWLRSPVLRWGALAACVVVVGAAVLTYRRSAQMELQAPAASREMNGAVVARQEVQRLPAEERVHEYAEIEAFKRPGSKTQSPDLADKGSLGKAATRKSAGSAAKLAVPRERFDQVVVSEAAPPAQTETVMVEAAKNAPPAPSANAVQQAPASREMAAVSPPPTERAQGKKDDEAIGGSPAKQKLEVPTATASVTESQVAGSLQERRPGSATEDANMKATVAQPSAEFAARIAKAAAADELVVQRTAKWSLTGEGLPQRSFDSGATWQAMPVDDSSGFRALSAVGPEVWVGGVAGVLYHSSDNGIHWSRVVPSVAGVQLNADITRIEFTDALHGRLSAADGATWMTSDGGKTWQKN